MPFKSEAQRKFFNSKGAKEAGITQKTTDEMNKASKGMELPERTTPEKKKGLAALKEKISKRIKEIG